MAILRNILGDTSTQSSLHNEEDSRASALYPLDDDTLETLRGIIFQSDLQNEERSGAI
jgi:hypothetical protein